MPDVVQAAPPPILVSLDEAARLLSCSRSMVKLMVRRGEIPTVKLGRLTRIPRGQVEELIVGRLEPAPVLSLQPIAAWVHRAGSRRSTSATRAPRAWASDAR